MSAGEVVLWVLLGLAALAVLAFTGIVAKFVFKAALSYSRRKPVQAAGFFAVPGGLATFVATFFGADLPLAMGIGLVTGLAVFLLVAMELG
ncbi:hypothetical protein Cme02nite_44870 [Catellatospora methionotrophica]|uniref:Uncharacterized protein n=1 Tax=Catellatospora methionotrophica TaxID=121620 RepID=A0A8J3LNU5_9ACTN|nr:hypothetical protein [Catellatospora methionotrophica]GIG16155.1 hypothetical protein Cme02nite_44870 [Catellatospora methionotrophica]